MAPTQSRFRATSLTSGPPSPTFSDATHASAFNFGSDGPAKIITRANLKASLQTYDDLMTTCANYRAALLAMSRATASFADAMERCSGLKGPSYEAGTRLQAASGVHHLMSNLWHVLADSLDKNFEKPLRQHLESYRNAVNERSASYERALREKSQIIRDTEMRSMNRKERNLQSFREALTVLQRQVSDLDELKASHYQGIIEHEEEVWDGVQSKVGVHSFPPEIETIEFLRLKQICVVVRSTMDVFDRFTSKASDPIIEPMLQSVPDPFDSYGPAPAEDQIFSILAPLSIMTAPSSSPSPMTGTPEHEIIQSLPESTKVPSWVPNTSNGTLFSAESTEWANVPSPSSTPPRSTHPPAPVDRRHSVPAGRTAESKLRSVLSVINESATHPAGGKDNQSESTPVTPRLGTSKLATTSGSNWSFTYGDSPYGNADDDDSTPRHSGIYASEPSRPSPSYSPTAPVFEPRGPDEHTDTRAVT